MTPPQIADEVLAYYATHFDEHARWLVGDGYRVHLVDPVERHVREAAGAGCTVEVGDARELRAGDSSYDVVLLLGSLYHLPELADRKRALGEAMRVVRPGGLVVAAGIQRFAALFDHASQERVHLDGRAERTGRVLATGRQLPQDSELFRSVIVAARVAEAHPELMVASSHLLAFGRRPIGPQAACP